MPRKYNQYLPNLKLKIATEALRGDRTINEIASEFQVLPCQVSEWKKQLKEGSSEIFSSKKKNKKQQDEKEDVSYLQQQIGRLTVELEWLKKKQGTT